MTLIDLFVIALIIVLIIMIVCKKKKYETFNHDDQEYSPQFVYSAGRIKPETPEEEYLDDYNSSATIRRKIKKDEENLYTFDLQPSQYSSYYPYEEPTYTQPTQPTQPTPPRPPFADLPISPPRPPFSDMPMPPRPPFSDMPILPPRPPFADMPILPQIPSIPEVNLPDVGRIKEETVEDTIKYSNVGKAIKKKKKIG